MSTFPWLVITATSRQGDRRTEVALRELRDRAAVYYRLGFTAADAARRLAAGVAWEYDPPARAGGAHVRPAALSDAAIAALVAETYARHPA